MFQIPYKNNLSSFNLSNERTIHLLSLLIVIIFLFLFFFPCHVIFAHDVVWGIFAMPTVFAPIFYLDNPFRFSTLIFALTALSGFQPSRFFYYFFKCCNFEAYPCWLRKASLPHPHTVMIMCGCIKSSYIITLHIMIYLCPLAKFHTQQAYSLLLLILLNSYKVIWPSQGIHVVVYTF